MAEKQVVRTDKAPGPFQGAPYNQAIRVGDIVFVAGQLGIALERPGEIAQLAVNARGERGLGEARADRGRDVGGRRSRRHFAHRAVRQADFEHLRHRADLIRYRRGAMAQAGAVRKARRVRCDAQNCTTFACPACTEIASLLHCTKGIANPPS